MKIARIVLLALWLALPATAHAAENDAAKILGQTPETGSLPIWTKPADDARRELGQTARLNERGVFLIGHPKTGTGTGWVVSKKHRLLVTNAHVADLRKGRAGN